MNEDSKAYKERGREESKCSEMWMEVESFTLEYDGEEVMFSGEKE